MVKFPFIDNINKFKERPAFCLTKPVGQYKNLVVSYITTNIYKIDETDILIDSKNKNFKLTNLEKTSVIKLHKLTTIGLEIVIGEIGKLPDDLHKKLKKNLKTLFNIK